MTLTKHDSFKTSRFGGQITNEFSLVEKSRVMSKRAISKLCHFATWGRASVSFCVHIHIRLRHNIILLLLFYSPSDLPAVFCRAQDNFGMNCRQMWFTHSFLFWSCFIYISFENNGGRVKLKKKTLFSVDADIFFFGGWPYVTPTHLNLLRLL